MDLTPWMERWHMLPEQGGIVLCGVSGGRDSVCLLDYLHKLGQQRGFTAAAGHLNHLMRPTAQRDEDFVRAFCAQRDIPFYTESADVYGLCDTWDLTVEETGRRARYDFLQRTAAAIGAEKIATAHHRDDLAETVLLQLLRGTGPQGLTGIPPVRGNIVRPLLDTPRRDIERYIAENGLAYVTDETNSDLAYARNRLRLEIWPELERINPSASAHIARTADILRRESAYLDELAAGYLPEAGTAVFCEVLLTAPEALRPRLLRLLLDRLGTGKKDVTAGHLAALEQLAAGEGTLALPGGAVPERRADAGGGGDAAGGSRAAGGEEFLRCDAASGEPDTCGGRVGAALRTRAGADRPVLAAGRPTGAAGQPGRAERQAPALRAGDPPRKTGNAPGVLRGWRSRRRVGRGCGQEISAGGFRSGYILHYKRKLRRIERMAKSNMDQDILKILLSEEEIKARVQELGDQLYDAFHDKNPLFVGVLKGCFIFMADLVRAAQLKSELEFIGVSSYQNGTKSSGVVQITRDLQEDINGRDVIIVEDILDSGNTLEFLKKYLMAKGAASVTIVTLLDKPARREKAITADYAGFVVPDEFVVGYGLDYAQQYRNMPYIGVLKPEVYSK